MARLTAVAIVDGTATAASSKKQTSMLESELEKQALSYSIFVLNLIFVPLFHFLSNGPFLHLNAT